MRKIFLILLILLSNFVFAQKCLVQENQIIKIDLPYTQLESSTGGIIIGYNNLSDSIHYRDGWRNIVTPEYDDSLQYLGLIYFDVNQNVCTYPVINKTQEQLQQEIQNKYENIDNSVDLVSVKKLLQVVLVDKLDSLLEEQLASAVNIFPVWREGKEYKLNEVVSHDTTLYRVIQPHTSQSDWKPNVAASLFTAYRAPEVVSDFIQPTGAHDAYMKGEKVRFNGQVYESLIDNNVWSPTGYPAGWKLL